MIRLACIALILSFCAIPFIAHAVDRPYFKFSKTTVAVGDTVSWQIIFTGSSNWGVTFGGISCEEADYDELFQESSGTVTFTEPGVYSFDAAIEYEVGNDEGFDGASCPTAYVTVVKKVAIKTQPKSVSVAEGKTATFKVVAVNATKYQWHYQKPGDATWYAVSNNGTSATYSLTTAARHNGYKYKVKVSNAAGYVWSNIVTLTVVSKPVITTQPVNKKVNEGATATFKVVASGSGLSYQWHYQKPGDATWYAVSNNGTSATYSLTTAARHNGYKYKVKVSNSAGYVWSNIVTLTVVSKPVITTQPVNKKVNEGATATFKVVAGGSGLSYQWHYQKPGDANWYAVSNNGTSATYSLTTAARHNGYKYKVKVSNSAGYVWSNVVTLTVVCKPVITSQPSSVTVAAGKTATFKVTATGATSYQWYYQKPGESTWNAVANNGTSATYSLTTAARHNGYKYKCEVKNAAGSVFSSVVTLHVT